VNRVEFDSTLDEVVDVNFRLAEHTKAFRRQRMWSQILVGGCLAAMMVVTVVTRGPIPPIAMVVVVAAAVAIGAFFGYLYRHFHNWYIQRHYRRMVKEMLGGADTVRCEFELRPDVLWCKTPVAETSFPWSRLTQVNDTEDSVEMWFDPGLAVVRNRAFPGPDDRRDFVEAVTKLRQRRPV
jgi:hypothetical protein